MKQILITTLLILMGCVSSVALSQVQVLGDRHAMQRISGQKNYLMLPVEEDEEGAHVKIIHNNKIVKEFNVRLAVNKVDYYVPVDISVINGKDALIDVDFWDGRNRRHSDIKNYICWTKIDYTDKIDTANRETRWRPIYHHTPTYGWMNDPNGMFYKDGVWNLYFQHNPYGSTWENMTWGHSTSTDLVNWTYQGDVIEPDALGTIFSGSSVVDYKNTAGFGEGAIISYYTSAGQSQTQSMAYSTDNGKTFTKYESNPVLTSNIPDFRDPNIFWHEATQRWILIISESQHMKFFSSANLKDWQFESTFGEDHGNHSGVWECPDLFEINGKWFLLCNINPGGPFGGSATQYFVGHFDGHKFTCEDDKSKVKWLDYGKDHYATVSFSNAPDGRIVVLPWMSNWQYANNVPTKQYRSANGLPRDLGSFTYKGETYLSVKPSKEIFSTFAQKSSEKLTDACRIDVQLKGSSSVTLSNEKGEQVVLTYDEQAETIAMDRRKSGETVFSEEFPVVTTTPTYGQVKMLRIFVDRSSIEIFDADGKVAMTNIVFPTEPYKKIIVSKKVKYSVYPFNK